MLAPGRYDETASILSRKRVRGTGIASPRPVARRDIRRTGAAGARSGGGRSGLQSKARTVFLEVPPETPERPFGPRPARRAPMLAEASDKGGPRTGALSPPSPVRSAEHIQGGAGPPSSPRLPRGARGLPPRVACTFQHEPDRSRSASVVKEPHASRHARPRRRHAPAVPLLRHHARCRQRLRAHAAGEQEGHEDREVPAGHALQVGRHVALGLRLHGLHPLRLPQGPRHHARPHRGPAGEAGHQDLEVPQAGPRWRSTRSAGGGCRRGSSRRRPPSDRPRAALG